MTRFGPIKVDENDKRFAALRRAASQIAALPGYVYAGAYVLKAGREQAAREADFERATLGMAAVSGMSLEWCRVVALEAYAANIAHVVALPERGLTPSEVAERMGMACAVGTCRIDDPNDPWRAWPTEHRWWYE